MEPHQSCINALRELEAENRELQEKLHLEAARVVLYALALRRPHCGRCRGSGKMEVGQTRYMSFGPEDPMDKIPDYAPCTDCGGCGWSRQAKAALGIT